MVMRRTEKISDTNKRKEDEANKMYYQNNMLTITSHLKVINDWLRNHIVKHGANPDAMDCATVLNICMFLQNLVGLMKTRVPDLLQEADTEENG